MEDNSEPVRVLPIRLSSKHVPDIHIHQFPLLTRPLQAPPSAVLCGKRIVTRMKPAVGRIEIHVPVDPRPEVWNVERAKELGAARSEDDREKNQGSNEKEKDGDPRLSELRLRSEQIPQQGSHFLGVVRNGELHLHRISETHQFRPTLTYLDFLSRKNKRRNGYDSDSDEGPPPDPDEPAPMAILKKEKDKKATGDVREVQVSARKLEDKGGPQGQGGLTAARREMLHLIRTEEDEGWQDIGFYDVTTIESGDSFEGLFSQNQEVLECKTDMTAFLNDIQGL
ncbi:hypothetical protein BD779DRAFT_1607357 [Infundibulicybe gibba]|nr:hypothetical protein BD779DRAFT_1607357 [Infundibulicybe gibba]